MGTLVKGNVGLNLGDGASPEVFTKIADDPEISWSGINFDNEETTDNDDTVKRKTFQSTLADEGTVSITFLYNSSNTQHNAVKTLARSGDYNNFELDIDDETGTFEGFVQSLTPATGVGELLKYTAVIKINGAITWA